MLRVLPFLILLGAAPEALQDSPAPMFRHARGCPKKCKTCEGALARGLAFLAENQRGDGSWQAGNGGTVVVTSLAALAMMANGSTPRSGPYARNIEKAARYLLRTVAPGHKGKGRTASGMSFEGFGNWDIGFAALFLGEYSLHVRNSKIATKIKWLIEKIVDNREPNGGWGHAKNFAYKDLVVATTACLSGLGSLKLAGFKVPTDVIGEGVEYFEDSSAGGIVGYSPRPGQKGWGKAGRASGAAYSMFKLGVQGKYFQRVVKYIQKNVKSIPEDHASPTLHYLFGGLFTRVLGGKYWREFVINFRDLWLGAQKEDGSFACPTESDVKRSMGMDVDALVGPNWPTAVFCLVFQLPYEKTNLTRCKIKTKKRSRGGLGLGGRKKPKNGTRTPTKAAKKPKGKPWLGLRVVGTGFGATVKGFPEKSPSADAGLEEGDIVVEFEGKMFDNLEDLKGLIGKTKPGKKVTLKVLRSGELRVVEVVVGRRLKSGGGTGSSEGEEI